MTKSTVFISCGQFTQSEKSLGAAAAALVHDVTGAESFFAEQVQDLNGLDTNILAALRNCAGFVVIMHPRGEIELPSGETVVRASVWIEQEIAIATYIQRIEKRSLPVIAFIHKDVSMEGIRALLHLNPIRFSADSEVLPALREQLQKWSPLQSSEVRIQLKLNGFSDDNGHRLGNLEVSLINDSAQRISAYNYRLRVPTPVLTHWRQSYRGEQASSDSRYREFVGDEKDHGSISPRTTKALYSVQYCMKCGITNYGDHAEIAAAALSHRPFEAAVWIDGREYNDQKNARDLAGVGSLPPQDGVSGE